MPHMTSQVLSESPQSKTKAKHETKVLGNLKEIGDTSEYLVDSKYRTDLKDARIFKTENLSSPSPDTSNLEELLSWFETRHKIYATCF